MPSFPCGLLDYPPSTIADMLVQGISSFTMLALPLFVFMGDIFVEGGSARPLINVIKSWVGRIPGGMGIATVFIAAFISAICGSSTAGIAMVAMIMIPEMVSLKYDKGFAGAIVASSGSMANLIPPSLFFILYGALAELNIATLFAAGMLPGVITAGVLAMVTYMVARRRAYPLPPPVSGAEKRQIFVKAIPALIMPVIVLGSIYGGIATPTECVLMLYVCVPLFYSTVLALGISPIHFGVVIVLGIMVGQSTPPMAEAIYVASSAGNVPSVDITRHILPFIIGLAIAFYVIILFPELSLIVPKLMGMVLP